MFFCLVMGGAILYQLFRAGERLRVDWANTLLVAGNIALVGLNLALLCQLWPRLKLTFIWGLSVFLLVAGICGCIYLAERWHEGFARHYDLALATNVFTWLEDKDFGDGKICALAVRYYPLFGSRRQHRVCQPVRIESAEWFLDYIEEEKIVLVVARPDDHSPGWNQFQEFDKCLARYPNRFRKVHESGGWLVFQVVGR